MEIGRSLILALALLSLLLPSALAGSLDHAALRKELNGIAESLAGKLGVCVQDESGVSCVNGDQRFSLQSTMKLVVAVAAVDAADQGMWNLRDGILVEKKDLSVFVQPLARKVGERGYAATIAELVHLAVTESDSAASDILMDRLGGPKAIQHYLNVKGIEGIRIDRNERDLQTEIFGLTWVPQYVDPAILQRDIERVPEAERDAAYQRYRMDERDTATPQGMAAFLFALAQGKVLSENATRHMLEVMRQTATGRNRLKAGMAQGWLLGHKTGTSNTWKGLTMATNDLGILTAPDGTHIAVSAFVGESTASEEQRDAAIARVAAAVVRHYRE